MERTNLFKSIKKFFWRKLVIGENLLWNSWKEKSIKNSSEKVDRTTHKGRRQNYEELFPLTFHFHALEKEMATHSSVLAWRIPGTGEPGGLLSMGSHRVGHDWSDLAAIAAHTNRYIFVTEMNNFPQNIKN